MKTALRPYTYLDTPDDTAMETFSLQVEDLDYKVSNLMGWTNVVLVMILLPPFRPEYSNFQTLVRFMIYTYNKNRITSKNIEGKTLK